MRKRLLVPAAAFAAAGIVTAVVLAATRGSTPAAVGTGGSQSEMVGMDDGMDMMGSGGMDMPGMESDGDGMPGMGSGGAERPPSVSSLPETPILSPTRMSDMVMPPGMAATADTSMEERASMAAVDPAAVSYRAPKEARGDRTLVPEIVDGVKVFSLEASLIRWNILPGVQVAAYAFNRQVPGPRIRVTQGDRVRIVVTNDLPELHCHVLHHTTNDDLEAQGGGGLTMVINVT